MWPELRKVLSLVLALAMCFSAFGVSASAANYDDYADGDTVKTEYAKNEAAIDVVTGLGIINGDKDSDGTLNLNLGSNLTRGQAAKILTVVDAGVEAAERSNSSTVSTGYTDMKGHWASGYVAYCTAKKFLAGNGDGTFEPEGDLTGYAFGKMLLNVMGVGLHLYTVNGTDTLVNDYVGDLWEAKVLADATELGLFEKVTSNPSGAITRADAMQMVYNMLVANNDLPGYGTANSKRTYKDDVAAEMKVTTDTTPADDFGRPLTKVFDKNGDLLTSFQDEPVLTYTKAVSGDQVWKDLGKPTDFTVTAVKDGADNDDVKVEKGKMDNVNGNGILTEVYKLGKGKDGKMQYKIVMVEDHFGIISSFKVGKPGEKNEISVSNVGSDGKAVGTFETDAYTRADVDTYVIYTTGKNGIETVSTAETFAGKPTSVKNERNETTTTVDGKTYGYHAKATAETSKANAGKDGKEVTYYLDSYGYIAFETGVKAQTKYAVLLETTTTQTLDGTTYQARLLLPDATTIDVETDKSYEDNEGALCSYTIDREKYQLVATNPSSKTVGTAISFNTNDTKLSNGSKVDGETVFLLGSMDGPKTVYKSYTGIGNVPSFKGAENAKLYAVKADGSETVTLVYVSLVDYTSNAATNFVYVPKPNPTETTTDETGTYYKVMAYVDGEVTEKTVQAEKVDAVCGKIGTSFETDPKTGHITGVTELTNAFDPDYKYIKTTEKTTVTLGKGTVIINGVAYATDENTEFYGLKPVLGTDSFNAIMGNATEANVVAYTYKNVVVAMFIEPVEPADDKADETQGSSTTTPEVSENPGDNSNS